MTTTPAPNRWLAIAIALVAAGGLAAAALTPMWLVNGDSFQVTHVGLHSMSLCDSTFNKCVHASNAEWADSLRESSAAFAPMGWVTLALCVLAVLGLAGAAAIAIAGKRPDPPIAPTTVALLAVMGGLLTGCVFVATKPGVPGFVGVGLSFWLFGGGSVLGIAGATLLAKVNRPPDPDLMDGAMNPDEF